MTFFKAARDLWLFVYRHRGYVVVIGHDFHNDTVESITKRRPERVGGVGGTSAVQNDWLAENISLCYKN